MVMTTLTAKIVQASGELSRSAHTSTPPSTRMSPGRTGTMMPIRPTTMRSGGTSVPSASDTGSTSEGAAAVHGLHEPVALVVDVGVADEGRDVLAAVVCAEQELSTSVERGPHVRLGAAAVAAVGCGQGRCQCGVHVGLLGSLGPAWCSVLPPVVDGERCNSQSRRMLPAGQGARMWRRSCPDRDLVAAPVSAVRPTPDGRPQRLPGRVAGAVRGPRRPAPRCACRGPSHPATTLRNVPTTAAKKAATTKSASEYTAHHLQVLEGLEAVRKRPGMYIGSTDSRGLMHCLWEIIDNAVDEALGGHCDHVEVILHHDGSVEVRDNGRGVPVDIEPRTGLTGVELVYTRLHAGGKFGGGSYTASGGLHGVGASVVNALSSRLDVEVDRGGKTYAMSFRRGEPGVFSDVAGARGTKDPEHPFTPYVSISELEVIGTTRRGVTGTRVRYWADQQIFLRDATFDLDGLIARARQTSFLVPGLTIVIRDQRGEEPTEEVFLHDGGISEFCEFLAPDPAVTDVWRLQGP